MPNSLELVARLSVLAFVLASMLSMGLSLSVREIHEPFRSPRMLLSVLMTNFAAIPLLAYLISKVIPHDPSLIAALFLLGTASGAPMLPKLVEFAKGNLALAVGVMGLLMAVTIVYVPIVLPMLLPGAHARAWSIGKPLLGVTLPPLAVGLAIRRYPVRIAAQLATYMRMASSLLLLALIATAIALNSSNIFRMNNLVAVVAGVVLFFGAFGIGYAVGGQDFETRKVLGLSAVVRNVSVSFLIAVENFPGANVVNYLAILGLVAIVIQLPLAFALGRRIPRPVAILG